MNNTDMLEAAYSELSILELDINDFEGMLNDDSLTGIFRAHIAIRLGNAQYSRCTVLCLIEKEINKMQLPEDIISLTHN